MVEESGAGGSRVNTPAGVFIRDMLAGTKLLLNSGAIVEVVENARDGGWLLARYLEHPDEPDLVGTDEWVFFGEIQKEVS